MERYYDFLYRKLRKKRVLIAGLFNDDLSDIRVLSVEESKNEIKKTAYNRFESTNLFIEWYHNQEEPLPIVYVIVTDTVQVGSGNLKAMSLDPEAFLIESDSSTEIFSFARIDQIETHIAAIDGLREHIISIYAGPARAFFWANKLSEFDSLVIGEYKFSKSDQAILVEEEQNFEHVEWLGQSYKPEELLLYLTSFEYFLTGLQTRTKSVHEAGIELTFKFLYKKLKVYGSAVCFFLFLLSALLFLKFSAQHSDMEADHLSQKSLATTAAKYREEISNLELLLNLSNNQPVHTKYAVEIGKELPKSINLIEMKLFPIEKSNSNRRKRMIKNWVIINGSGVDITTISNWVGSLKENHWVNKIISQEIVKEGGNYLFELRLEVSDV